MFAVLRRSCGRHPRFLARNFAEIVPSSTQAPLKGTIDPPPPKSIAGPDAGDAANNTESDSKVVNPVRLGNRVSVREDHGLWAFFRKKEPEPGQTLEGEAQYETLGGSQLMEAKHSGRSWKASELRLKSFEDLHTLWYILLRERNLLATQQEEVRRLGVMRMLQLFNNRVRSCRKSMARIKYVMNERRLAYEGVVKLAEEEKTAHITNLVLQQQKKDHQKERKKLVGRQKNARLRLAAQRAREEREAKKRAEVEQAEAEVAGAAAAVSTDAPSSSVEHAETKAAETEAPAQPEQSAKTAQPEAQPAPKAPRTKSEASSAAAAGLFGKHR